MRPNICLCLQPDRTWPKVNDPKVDYSGDLGSNPAGLCWSSEQATPVNSIKDVVRSSVKVPKFDKHLKTAGGYIDRNVVEITIKMKTIVRKPLMIKKNMLWVRIIHENYIINFFRPHTLPHSGRNSRKEDISTIKTNVFYTVNISKHVCLFIIFFLLTGAYFHPKPVVFLCEHVRVLALNTV